FLPLVLTAIISSCSFTNTVYIDANENNPIVIKADFSGNYVAPVSNKNGADIYFKIEPDKNTFTTKVNQNGSLAKLLTDVDHYLVYLIKNDSTSFYPSGGDPFADKVVGPFSISAAGLASKTVRFTNVPDSLGKAYYVAIRVQDASNNDLLKDNNGLVTPWGTTTQGITSKIAVSSGQGVTVDSAFKINT
ncbi:MAG: hypothetical protein ACK4IX_14625, partial [Candidatus Sericytochromatia bacterium]